MNRRDVLLTILVALGSLAFLVLAFYVATGGSDLPPVVGS